MKRVFILYNRFYDINSKKITVGGIQTYIQNLCEILVDNNMEPLVYQFASEDFEVNVNGTIIRGVNVEDLNSFKKKKKALFNSAMEKFDVSCDIMLFATESLIVPVKGVRTICIQHGVGWDKPMVQRSKAINFLRTLYDHLRQYQRLYQMSKVNTVVCVDYNFVNWYRAAFPDLKINYKVILNFSKIASSEKKQMDKVSIIFARRFFEYRGTRLFATVIKRVLEKYKDIKVTIAGEGPDEEYLKNMLEYDTRVRFIRYESENSLEIHSEHDIAVIPTKGSEGSSLSLIEAMASGCAVICTDVGGMTNIIINEFNGLMIRPNEDDLYIALSKVIEDKELRDKLSSKGRETAVSALSFERWKQQWLEVFQG